jgi:hypothetical protein
MTRNPIARTIALLGAIAVLLAACGGTTATTAPTGAAPTVAPPTQAAASVAPGFSFGPGFSIDLPSDDKDLEAILPSDLGGVALQKFSMTGESFMAGGTGAEDMAATLQLLGKTPADLSVAFAGNTTVILIAFKVKDVGATQIYDAVVAAQDSQDVANITDVTIAGKSAKKVVDSTSTTVYLYLTGDAVITVTGVGALPDATLNEIFTKLP